MRPAAPRRDEEWLPLGAEEPFHLLAGRTRLLELIHVMSFVARVLKTLKDHEKGCFLGRIHEIESLSEEERELALWLNNSAQKQQRADQLLQDALHCDAPVPDQSTSHWERRAMQVAGAITHTHRVAQYFASSIESVSSGNLAGCDAAVPIGPEQEHVSKMMTTLNRFRSTITLLLSIDSALDRAAAKASTLLPGAWQEIVDTTASALDRITAESRLPLAGLGNEIRTPINGIMGMTELLLDTPLSTLQREYLTALQSSAHTLLSLLNDLHDWHRICAGRLTLDQVEFSLQSTIHATLHALASADRRRIPVSCDLPPSTPDALVGDPARLRQVLTTLLVSATDPVNTVMGEILLSVRWAEHVDNGVLLNFSISENTSTVTATERQAGQPSNQSAYLAPMQNSICQRLVELMQGTLRVRSQLGGGSMFYFTATFRKSSLPPTAPAASAPTVASVSSPPPLIPMHVLVAEDNLVNQKLITRILTKLGHTVTTCCNGEEAVARAKEMHYDLIFMDIQMPVLGGFEATALIRHGSCTLNRYTPILGMTAHAVSGFHEHCIQGGMDGFISKPFRIGDLRREVELVSARMHKIL